jgi:hypothetical protein
MATSRRAGRPKKGDGPAFPTDEVDKLLVSGELTKEGKSNFPSMRDIAQRFGVSHSVISEYSKRHDCINRRHRIGAEARDLSDKKVAESLAASMVVDKAQMDKLACEFMGAFGTALREGRVRADNFADFNQAVRLVQLLRGEADTRQEHLGGITLERLGERHRVWLETMTGPVEQLTGEIAEETTAEQASCERGEDVAVVAAEEAQASSC